MSQTYRIGSLNFTGSQAVLSASLNVSGSSRFAGGLTVTGSFQAQGVFSVDKDSNGSGSMMIPAIDNAQLFGYQGFPSNPKTGSMFYSSNEDKIYIYSGVEWKFVNLTTPG